MWVSYIPTYITSHDVMGDGQCLIALPCKREEVYGSATLAHNKQAQSTWLEGAERTAKAIGLKRCHPLLVGILHLTPKTKIAIVALMTLCCIPPEKCCLTEAQTAAALNSTAEAELGEGKHRYAWCATTTLGSQAVAKLAAAVEGRLRALRKPTPAIATAEALQIGVGKSKSVNRRPQADQGEEANVRTALALCKQLQSEICPKPSLELTEVMSDTASTHVSARPELNLCH